jgi:hypothetical protein
MTSSLWGLKGCPGWDVIITYVHKVRPARAGIHVSIIILSHFSQIFGKKLALKHFFIIKKLPPYNLVGFDITTLNSADGDGSTM